MPPRSATEERPLPRYVEEEFEAYLKCGRLEEAFLRVKCDSCQADKLVTFSCKRRGFCPSCGARQMAETAALLVDDVLPRQPVRQWVLSLPFALRYLLATRPEVVTQVLGIVYRAVSGHLIRNAGLTRASAGTGAVTLIQRFGSALNLNVHFHLLVLDGVYRWDGEDRLRFVPVPAPSTAELKRLVQRIADRIGRSLERSGLITRDIENAYLAFDPSRAICRSDHLSTARATVPRWAGLGLRPVRLSDSSETVFLAPMRFAGSRKRNDAVWPGGRCPRRRRRNASIASAIAELPGA